MKTALRALDVLDRAIGGAVQFTAMVGAGLLLLMMLHVCADVLSRLFASRPLPGTTAMVANWWMVIVCFLPLGLVERRDAMISVTLIKGRLGPGLRRAQALAVALAGALVFSILALRAADDAVRSLKSGRVVIEQGLAIPTWPPHFILPVGFGLAAVVVALRALRIVLGPPAEVSA